MEIDDLFADADFFGIFRQDYSNERWLVSRFLMKATTRNPSKDSENISGTGSDCLGEFTFEMGKTPTTIIFQKKYSDESIKKFAGVTGYELALGVVDYELKRCGKIGEKSENYFAGYWNLFATRIRRKINGPACMVDLNEARYLGREKLEKEIEEFCDAIKHSEAVRDGVVELNQRN